MGQLQSQAAQGQGGDQQAAWWCKLLARTVGAVGGGIAFILGIWTCVGVSAWCIIAGILQMIAAFIVLVMETPCCCQYFDIARPIANFSEGRPFFQKAAIYCAMAIPPLAMCFGLSTLFGSGLIFAAGVLYGLMALGKKADKDEMARNAGGTTTPTQDKSNLVDNAVDPTMP